MSQVLILASVASMIDQFNMPNIHILLDMGCTVEVACNFVEGNTCPATRIAELKQTLNQLHITTHQIDFSRNVFDMQSNIKAYKQVKQLMKANSYDFVHAHSPIGGVVARLAGKSTNTKIIYTAHGFHFYQGAPKKNWILFYPVEKFLSHWTHILITITKEDYALAKNKFKATTTEYIPGIGVDISKFKAQPHFHTHQTTLLSVGELNENKNHQAVIQALAELQKENKLGNIQYLICGQGKKEEEYRKLIQEYGLEETIHLMGFCKNIKEYYDQADIFVFPSHREGLSVALMEAMANGLPVVCSKIRGNVDLVDENGGYLFDPDSIPSIKEALYQMMESSQETLEKYSQYNQEKIKNFDQTVVNQIMKNIYRKCIERKDKNV